MFKIVYVLNVNHGLMGIIVVHMDKDGIKQNKNVLKMIIYVQNNLKMIFVMNVSLIHKYTQQFWKTNINKLLIMIAWQKKE